MALTKAQEQFGTGSQEDQRVSNYTPPGGMVNPALTPGGSTSPDGFNVPQRAAPGSPSPTRAGARQPHPWWSWDTDPNRNPLPAAATAEFFRMYGTQTPGALARGIPQPPGQAPPPPPPSPSAPPEQAGAMNASMPGMFNGPGGSANGYAPDIPNPLAAKTRAPMDGQQFPQMPQTLQTGYVPPGVDPAQAPAGQVQPDSRTYLSPGMQVPPPPPASGSVPPPPQAPGQQPPMQTQDQVPTQQQPAAPAPTTWTNPNGQEIEWSKTSWEGNPNVDPVEFIRNSGDAWTDGFWKASGYKAGRSGPAVSKLPPPSQYQYDGAQSYIGSLNMPTSLSDPLSADYVKDPQVRNLLRWGGDLAKRVDDLSKIQGSARQQGKINTANERLGYARAALEQYGIQFDPFGANPPPAGGGDPGGGGGGTPPPGGGVPPGGTPPPVSGTDIYAGNTDSNFGGAQDLNNIITQDAIRFIGSQDSPQNRIAALELAFNIQNQGAQNLDRQQAINILTGNAQNQSADPLRQQVQSLASGIMQNPNSVDFQTIRNQEVERNQRGLNDAMNGLSSDGARRGLSAGTLSGTGAALQRESNRDISSRLGSLSIQEQMQNRQDQLQAIDTGTAISSQFQNQDSMMAQLIANALMQTPQEAVNPSAGGTDLSTGLRVNEELIKSISDQTRLQGEANRNQLIGSGLQLLGSGASAYYGG